MKYWFTRLARLFLRFRQRISEQVFNTTLHLTRQVATIGLSLVEALIPMICLVAVGFVVYDLGFNKFYSVSPVVTRALSICLYALKVSMILQFASGWFIKERKLSTHLYNLGLIILTFYLHRLLHDIDVITNDQRATLLWKKLALYGGLIYLLASEASPLLRFVYIRRLNPAFIFMSSFGVIILTGSLLLLLPNATTEGIGFLDALFTSTSAVCVTGLIVVDTGTAFTSFGKLILMVLIQIGGLGIMTFTGLFSYLVAGSVSIQNQVALKDMLSANKMSTVMQFVSRIIIVTFFFEMVGAVLIHGVVGTSLNTGGTERIFFAIFHSISAFCNAGFSTLTDGLYTGSIRNNYTLQLVIAMLVVLGGLGFPIVFNLFSLIRIRVMNVINKILKIKKTEIHVRVISINAKLVIVTSVVLLLFGFISYLVFEENGTLKGHPTMWGKIVTSIFGSVTPRTAGFNTVNIAELTLPMLMIYLLLMWIGASPGSTGGGIKTTTASIALLNIVSVIRGKNRTEVFHSEISQNSINRAFAIILVSLLLIGGSTLILVVYDGEKGIMPLAFEAFSAFSTVGLSLGVTPDMSIQGRIVLILLMFVGRVGAITFLVAFVNQTRQLNYRYPKEDILY